MSAGPGEAAFAILGTAAGLLALVLAIAAIRGRK